MSDAERTSCGWILSAWPSCEASRPAPTNAADEVRNDRRFHMDLPPGACWSMRVQKMVVCALVRRVRIFYRTAVRTRRRRLHLLAGHSLLEGATNVVSRSADIVQIGCRLVVDGTIVDHDALRIDNDHLRRCLRVVKMADLSDWVEQRSGRRSLHFRQVFILLARSHISLFARRRRDNREPDDALPGPVFLQALHIAAFVVLAHVRAPVVVPLKHYVLAAVILEAKCFSATGRCREVRRCLADFRSRDQQRGRADYNRDEHRV